METYSEECMPYVINFFCIKNIKHYSFENSKDEKHLYAILLRVEHLFIFNYIMLFFLTFLIDQEYNFITGTLT